MSLDVDAAVTLGEFTLDVRLTVTPGEVVAVVGPNGAGKSTLLRAVAGLRQLDRGTIAIDGDPVDDAATDRFVAPEHRRVGVVFQDYRLFPHMSALDNVAFGLRARGQSRHVAREVAAGWLDRVGLGAQARLRPGSLSGGQAQRVALSRALATDPRVLLLDEPLAALDVGARAGVRRDLQRHLAGFDGMVLVVSHDPVEAHALAGRLVVLEGGRVSHDGTLAELAAHPRSRYVADLVGVNLVDVEVRGGTAISAGGAAIALADMPAAGRARLSIRPRAVSLHRGPPGGSPRNAWLLVVTDIDHLGERARVSLGGSVEIVAEVTESALTELAARPGDELWASVKATDIIAVGDGERPPADR